MELQTNHHSLRACLDDYFLAPFSFSVATFWLASYRCIVNYTISEPNKQPGLFETYFLTFSKSYLDRPFAFSLVKKL